MMAKKAPKFANIDEMARFWDENDSTEFEGEVEDVKYEPKRVVLSVRFDPGDIIALNRKARALGMDKSTFVRFIVKQYLGARANRDEMSAEIAPPME